MVSVIYFNLDESLSFQTLKTLTILNDDVQCISTRSANIDNVSAEYLIAQNGADSETLQSNFTQALNAAASKNVLIISEVDATDALLQKLIDCAKAVKDKESFALINSEFSKEVGKTTGTFNPGLLVNSIGKLGLEFVHAFAASKEVMLKNIYTGFNSYQSLLHGEFISQLASEEEITTQIFDSKNVRQLQKSERAYLLEQVLNLFNIEELYSELDWQTHSSEAASCAYHNLAAIFIKLEDFSRAEDCLNISDELEESPRSMALRALISNCKGETLQAVAGLVSSLQHYEVRKKNENNRHYLEFVPKDLEVINQRLSKGLTALNHRDNETALFHFADAIYNFDDFYKEHELKSLLS